MDHWGAEKKWSTNGSGAVTFLGVTAPQYYNFKLRSLLGNKGATREFRTISHELAITAFSSDMDN